MSDDIKIKVDGADDAARNLKAVYNSIVRNAIAIINRQSLALQTQTRQAYFGPYAGESSRTTLQTRTGNLKNSIKVKQAKADGDSIKGGLTFGTVYSGVLIGKRDQVTTIRPTSSQYLAIPLADALTARGVARGRPRDESVWGKTFIARSKKGSLIIFGQKTYTKGARAGETRGDVLPLFVLKKQVMVHPRIDPNELIEWVAPRLNAEFDRVLQNG